MNGKFHKSWGDFGTLRNLEAMEYECFRALAYGAKCCVGDQLHPSGRIDATVYHRIAKVYGSVEQKEPWCRDTRKLSQVGVFAANRALEDCSIVNEGVYRVLSKIHVLYDVIDFASDLEKPRFL